MEIHARNSDCNALHAELTGNSTCTAAGITARGYAPVLELCRKLIAGGHHPAIPLAAWRGDTLCLFVHSIGEAAELEPSPRGVGFVCRPDVRGRPPIEPIAPGATELRGRP